MISIIVNWHNGEKYLKKCISSILSQSYKKFEIIFFDNSSTDKSREIIHKYKDYRIKYFFSKKKIPLYKARNEAIKKTNYNLIAFLDVDDWWDKNYLLEKKKYFTNHKIDYFYSNVYFFYEKKNKFLIYNKFKLPQGKIFKFLAKNYFIIISGLIIRKKILKKENYFNKNYNIIGDYDLLMKISRYANAKSFNDALVYYRVHDKNFAKINNKIFYNEYKDWFLKQSSSKNADFERNKKYFLLKLKKLEIIYLLYKKKNFKLLLKIIKLPNILLKLKFLIAILLPLKFVKYLRK